MKLLIIPASLDLTQPFSATPAWWQWLKALYEIGVDVVATPYQGAAIESLWWRAEPNPAQWQGDSFKSAPDTLRKLVGEKPPVQIEESHQQASAFDSPSPQVERGTGGEVESATDKLIRQTVHTFVTPIWARHLNRILTKQPDIDA